MSDAVNRYLLALHKPQELVDQDKAEKLEQTLSEENEPLQRVLLQAELRQARQVPIAALEDEFVKEAKEWADKNGVVADDLVAEGVDPEVLRRAKFPVGQRRSASQRRSAPQRRRRDSEEVRRQIMELFSSSRKPLAVRDLDTRLDLGRGTGRRIVKQLVAEGELEEAGVAPTQGAGRSPTLYRKPRKRKS